MPVRMPVSPGDGYYICTNTHKFLHIFWSLCYFLLHNSAGHCVTVPSNGTVIDHIFCSCIRTDTSKYLMYVASYLVTTVIIQ